AGAWRQYQIPEGDVLPFVAGLLGREIADLQRLITLPPDRLAQPDNEQERARERMRAERDRLSDQVTRAQRNLLAVDDPRTVKTLSAEGSPLRGEVEGLEAETSAATT